MGYLDSFQAAELQEKTVLGRRAGRRKHRVVSFSVWGTRSNFDGVEVKDIGWRGRQEPGPREPYILEMNAV